MNIDNNHESKASHFLRPYWIQEDVDFDSLSEGQRAALEGIIEPAYKNLVAATPSALERLTAMSTVHLAHLEVIDQIDLGRELAALPPEARGKRIDGHLRLVAAKLKCAAFLHRLHRARGPSDGARPSL